MTSRLTAFAATFAVLAAVMLTFAAGAQQPGAASRAAQAKQAPVVQLATVVVTGHRSSLTTR